MQMPHTGVIIYRPIGNSLSWKLKVRSQHEMILVIYRLFVLIISLPLCLRSSVLVKQSLNFTLTHSRCDTVHTPTSFERYAVLFSLSAIFLQVSVSPGFPRSSFRWFPVVVMSIQLYAMNACLQSWPSQAVASTDSH